MIAHFGIIIYSSGWKCKRVDAMQRVADGGLEQATAAADKIDGSRHKSKNPKSKSKIQNPMQCVRLSRVLHGGWWIGASCSCGQDRWFAAQPSTPRNPSRGHNCPQNAGNLNPKSSQCIFSTSLSLVRLSQRWIQMVTVVCTHNINIPQISHVHSICTMYIYFGVSLQALLVS